MTGHLRAYPMGQRGMSLESIQRAVLEIESCKRDYEHAHSLEDRLHHRVLEAIANGLADDPSAWARAALETREIKFDRHCA